MRHRKTGVKLNRTSSHRDAMFRNMVTSLFKYERIRTTDAKAKELRRWADRLVTLAKRGDLHARRQAMSIVREKDVVHKLFEEAPKRYGQVAGGYTRVIKLGYRPGDAASMSLVEMVTPGDRAEGKPRRSKPQAKGSSPAAPAAAAETAAEAEAPAAVEGKESEPVEAEGAASETAATDAGDPPPAEPEEPVVEKSGEGEAPRDSE